MKRYNYVIPLAIVVFILILTTVRNRGEKIPEYCDSRIMMDTFVEIRIWGRGSVSGEAAVDSAFAVIARIAALLGEGIITASESGVLAEPEADSIMAISQRAWDETGGLFDPTIGSVSRLWEFYGEAAPPDADSVDAALEFVGLGAYLSQGISHGQAGRDYVLDVGGVAKGYALDLAAAEITRLGFRAALLNAGGDIKIVGEKPGGGRWRIAIRHPRNRDAFLGCLEVGPVSIATSGDYERCFVHEGTRYHHVLDPRTGMPSRSSVSVTVIGRDAGFCDALATGLFVMGVEQALALAESLPGIEAVFVTGEELDVVTTSGISDSFERLE
jgi:thiamine biosynthesis lipoprotein